MTSIETRADRFTRELNELKIPDPSAGRGSLWLRLGVLLMVLGPVLGVVAYFMSHGTSDPLEQRDAIIIALTSFLRFWLARQSFDLALFADHVVDKGVSS